MTPDSAPFTHDEVISDLLDLTVKIDRLSDDLGRAKHARDQLIIAAVRMGVPRDDLAFAAGVSRQRIHAITRH